MMAATTDDRYDEVLNYQNFRSIGSSEACWRIFEFPISRIYPNVVALPVHLPERQYVLFQEGEEEDVLNSGPPASKLDQFFAYNIEHPDCDYSYVDFPKFMVWKCGTRNEPAHWQLRQKGTVKAIGRIHSIHPSSGDEFYLRMLLYRDHCKSAKSFNDLLFINGRHCETYKEVNNTFNTLKLIIVSKN